MAVQRGRVLGALRRALRGRADRRSRPPDPVLRDGLLVGRARRIALVLSVGLVALLLPAGAHVLGSDYDTPAVAVLPLAAAQMLPLLLALSRPRTGWLLALAAATLTAMVARPAEGTEPWPWLVPAVFPYLGVLVLAALRGPRWVLAGMWLATLAAGALLGAGTEVAGTADNLVLMAWLSGAALVLGDSLRGRWQAQQRLVEVARLGEAERARRTLLEERARIARELHDVVAHHMSVITVQADSAPFRLPGLAQPVADEFASIAAEARGSLTEMRRLLDVLRGEEGAERMPQPGLARLPELAEATRRAGVPVELTVDGAAGPPDEPPGPVQLSAFRIVQEALSNVIRHAPGAPATVTVTRDATALRVTVVNAAAAGTGPDGPAPARPVETVAAGHGLVGMRERVGLLGGELAAGPLPDGGYRVAAVLPLAPEAGQ